MKSANPTQNNTPDAQLEKRIKRLYPNLHFDFDIQIPLDINLDFSEIQFDFSDNFKK